jgi:hypothetical protein
MKVGSLVYIIRPDESVVEATITSIVGDTITAKEAVVPTSSIRRDLR